MIYADTKQEVEIKRKAFLRKWRLKCPAVAVSLEDAGDKLFTFIRFPGRLRDRQHPRPGSDAQSAEVESLITPILHCLALCFQFGAIGPDRMKDDCHIAGYGYLGLLGGDTLDKFGAPPLERGSSADHVQQHIGGFEQLGSDQHVATFREASLCDRLRPIDIAAASGRDRPRHRRNS
jgi:hypothetical protein